MLTSLHRGKGKEETKVKGLTSDYQLTLPAMLKRAEVLYGPKEIVTRRPDKSFHRYTYADFVRRAKKLAVALGELGLHKSDRVATLAWNNCQHLEAFFGISRAGLVLVAAGCDRVRGRDPTHRYRQEGPEDGAARAVQRLPAREGLG
jgi:non-ribosomal peptide synthetase component E (peptide arylation enzyme)